MMNLFNLKSGLIPYKNQVWVPQIENVVSSQLMNRLRDHIDFLERVYNDWSLVQWDWRDIAWTRKYRGPVNKDVEKTKPEKRISAGKGNSDEFSEMF